MLSCRTPRSGSRARWLAAAALLTLGGCSDGGGFRPMYGALSSAGETDRKLSQVDFATIPGRIGQRVRNELVFQGNRGDPGGASLPSHRLEVVLRESLTSVLVQRDGEAGSQIYSLEASFRLIRIADKQIVFEGTSFGRAGFERFSSIFSNVRAREDAENRAAKVVADEMKNRLAAYLSRPA